MKKEELKKFDGKEGRKTYFAYKGKIYDVSNSKLWKNGSHVNRHFAGEDLTDQLAVAPHNDEVITKFPEVGSLEPDQADIQQDRMDQYRDLYRKYHPHPILIHFPMGLFFFSVIMQALFHLFSHVPFENAAFFSIVIASLTSIPATLSGIISWWINYQLIFTRIFKMKLYFSIVLIVVGLSASVLRFVLPDISSQPGFLFFIYNILLFITFPVVSIIGYYGGKITWPG